MPRGIPKNPIETRKKQSESMLGKNTWMKGKKLSKETIEKIREKTTGDKNPFYGKKHTMEARQKNREKHIGVHLGEKSPRWKGGITPLNHKIRTSTEYKLWRIAVLERDNYTCIWCGAKEKLEVDHIKPFALFPELRFAIDNGRILCKKCHITTDTYSLKKYGK